MISERTLTLTLTLTLTWTVALLGQLPSTGWKAAPASGVELRVAPEGTALRVDFDFRGRGGWAAFRKDTTVMLPENYEISFKLKANAPKNTLEFKLIDASGENVWWVRRPEFEFAGDWRTIRFRKRHVEFAWGPKGGGDIREVAAIEFAITAGEGGKGTAWIDSLFITPRPPVTPPIGPPIVSRVANTYMLDLRSPQEYGGLSVVWKNPGNDRAYDVQISTDGQNWQTIRSVRNGRRTKDLLQMPETESRYVRVVVLANDSAASIVAARTEPLEFGKSLNRLFEQLASETGDDRYPHYFYGKQTYWTVIGNPAAPHEALINEHGAVEIGKRSFSLEPFIHNDTALVGWRAANSTRLESGYLPIPSVRWEMRPVWLRTLAWVDDTEVLWIRYRIGNPGAVPRKLTLYVAMRPFQVNPPAQFLNTAGGATSIKTITSQNNRAVIDSTHVVAVTTPAAFGATSFDQGDITDYLRRGVLPPASGAVDSAGLASAAFAFPLELGALDVKEVHIAVPFSAGRPVQDPVASLRTTMAKWREQLDRFNIEIPARPDIGNSVRSNLAYILINQDGPAIQPGSRSYERSWIRDGSLTSAALLRLGHAEAVGRFAEWYAPYQYADGKVPCCVDRSGAGAVPENDSHGQLIYLIAEYFRYTKDTTLVRRTWKHVERAVAYMDSLRNSRRTAEFRGTGFWGMMPQSISHEGYSAKPMHSYWDDFFALKGFKDAVWLAEQIGDRTSAAAWTRMRDEFNTDLMNSFRWTMQKHGIDYLAGSVELGDFDATSTTVGLNPAGAQDDLPQAALRRTFERYWEEFVQRRVNWAAFKTRPDTSSKWSAYTPYEWRVVGALIRLGERKRAHEVADWFMEHQRPNAWNHWAEVVFRDPLAPKFIGDMPHTWVGSDFIRSILDMFVYDENETLIIGAGIAPEWVERSVDTTRISGIRTPYGEIAYRIFKVEGTPQIHFRFDKMPTPPPNGFVVRSVYERPIRGARADGRNIAFTSNEVRLKTLPRELVLVY